MDRMHVQIVAGVLAAAAIFAAEPRSQLPADHAAIATELPVGLFPCCFVVSSQKLGYRGRSRCDFEGFPLFLAPAFYKEKVQEKFG